MMLAKNWWKRRAQMAPESELMVELFATELEGETEHGTYYVRRAGGDGWEVKFRPRGWRLDQRELAIDARHEDGGPMDWPSRSCAEEALRLHARLMGMGHGALRAAELVAQRSQQVVREWRAQRPVVLDYAQPREAVSG